ncbi:MAG: hypothetical protein GEU75_10330 [Dehalococcoidia bacterium]|nr:hypothetical protein [Dehalococcoidia bacterium]
MTTRRDDPDDEYEIIERDTEAESDDDDDDDDLSDPEHPDHDLSEWSAYSPGVRDTKPWFTRRWLLILISVLVILGLVLPFLQRF